ncbi:PRPF39 (predicted), partial [Pycnogonum litorale]
NVFIMAENGDKLPKAENDSDADEKQVESKYPTMNGDADTSELDADADSDSLKKDGEECQEESELEKVWSAVKQNPQDFTSWTYLLQHVEQMDDLEQARKAFDEFFELYPYCYGYWKKYADIEKKNENCDAAQKVYERGLDAIPLSVDLWIHYVTYYKSLFEENANEESTSHIRVLFERAVVAAGKEFRSDKLWEMYIIWEGESGRLLNVLNLYDRLLNTPTIQYSQHFERFKEFVEQNDPKEFLKESEYGEILKEEDTKMEQAKNDKEKKGDDEHEDEVIRDEDSKEISVDTIRVNLIARREVIF